MAEVTQVELGHDACENLDYEHKLSEHEIIKPATHYAVLRRCERCEDGYMMSDPNSEPNEFGYPHKCDKCGLIMYFKKVYPYIKWKIEGVT